MVAYLVLTFVASWSLWFASGLGSAAGPGGALFFLGVFAPGIVAVLWTARRDGARAVASLLHRLIDFRFGPRWFLFALGYMAAVKLSVAVMHRAMYGVWPRFGTEPWYLMVGAILLSMLVFGQAGEEIGWRGFVLPRLAERWGFGLAGIAVGIIWATWHLPLFLFPGGDTYRQSFPLYLLQVTALSVAMAWLYSNTHRSLVPVMLFHSAVNNTKDIVPSADRAAAGVWALGHSRVGWLTVAVLWLCALYFLIRMRSPRQNGT